MKNLLVICLFLFVPGLSKSQDNPFPIDSLTKKVNYSEVVSSQSSKDVLYDRALEWFALSFKSSNDVIQIKDKEAGKIVGSFTVFSSEGGPVVANIIVLVKDNRYKYSITDIIFSGSRSFKSWTFEEDPNPWKVGMMKKGINYIKNQSQSRLIFMVKDLKSKMSTAAPSDDF